MSEVPGQMRVAYLVSQYPALSHVFIEREIEGLRQRGVEVTTYSIRPPVADGLLSEKMRDEGARTTVLLRERREIFRALSRLARHHSTALASVLALASGTGELTARSRLRQLFYLAEAIRLHDDMRRQGLRHVHVHFGNNGADVARLAVAIGRAIDGVASSWMWTITIHGPGEFAAVEKMDLAEKMDDATAVACISDFTRSQLMKLTSPSSWAKFQIVRMSVDTNKFVPPAQGRSHDGPIRVLYVGRLVSEKGGPVLLSAIHELHAAGRGVQVKMIGSGPLAEELQQQIVDLGLSGCVELVGAVGQDEIRDYYWWADAFCLPSFQEGLPVVLMEAMATDLPVITTRIAGIPELVHHRENGLVVSPGRSDLIADSIADLDADAELRQSLGERGREEVAEHFSLESASDSQLEFLRRAQQGICT